MTPRAAGAALGAPLRDSSQLLSGLLFWLPVAVGLAVHDAFAGRFRLLGVGVLLLALAISLPGFVAYLLRIVEAQALGRRPAVPGIESFVPLGGERRLFPLVPVAALVALSLILAASAPLLAILVPAALGSLLLPLNVMLLAVTEGPLASISPPGLWRLARRLWPDLLWAPAAAGGAAVALLLASRAGLPDWLLLLCATLLLLSIANLCGALLATLDVAAEISIPAAPPGTDALTAATERRRLDVLNHAYGMVSRGNRAGGLAHIEQSAATESDPLAAELWFFEALWRWDLGEVPLFYGQALLTRLLDAGEDVAAMKLTLRCLRSNPRFRPRPGDLPRLVDAAIALGNDEVAAALRR